MPAKKPWLNALVETEVEAVMGGDDIVKAHLSEEGIKRLHALPDAGAALLMLKEVMDSYDVRVVCNLQTPKFAGMVSSAEECLAFKCISIHILQRTMELVSDPDEEESAE